MNEQLKKLAVIAGGITVLSGVAFTLAFAQADTTPPSMPTGLSLSSVSTSSIDLTWAASTDNVGVTGYGVFRNGSQVATTSATSYDDTGLAAGTTYTYTVDAFDAAGNLSTQSSSVSTSTLSNTPPSIPGGLVATAVSSSQVNLSWNTSTDSNGTLSGYDVYRNGTLIGSTSATSFSDTGLSGSTTYVYTVAAFDTVGNTSSQSSSASATTFSSGSSGSTATTTVSVPPTVDISANGSILIHGLTVTSVGTDTFTGTVWGITYTVNYTPNSNNGFQFLLRGGNSASVNSSQIQVGDVVGVQGTVTQASPNTITGQIVRNYSITNPRSQNQNNGNGNGNNNYGFGNGSGYGSGASTGAQSIQSLQSLLQQLLGQFRSIQERH